jgi:hypothetical protein
LFCVHNNAFLFDYVVFEGTLFSSKTPETGQMIY